MSKFAVYGTQDNASAFKPRQARAYCDGRKANVDGFLLTDNPFQSGSPPMFTPNGVEYENALAWEAGHNDVTGGVVARDTACAV